MAKLTEEPAYRRRLRQRADRRLEMIAIQAEHDKMMQEKRDDEYIAQFLAAMALAEVSLNRRRKYDWIDKLAGLPIIDRLIGRK